MKPLSSPKGLVRGLAQVDTGFGTTHTVVPFMLMAIESLVVFGCDRISLDLALKNGWVKPFKAAPPTPEPSSEK